MAGLIRPNFGLIHPLFSRDKVSLCMNQHYGFFFIGLLGLFLMGTDASAVAAPQKAKKATAFHAYHGEINLIAYQKKRPNVVESLIRPSQKGKKTPSQIYRHDKARDALKSGHIVSLSVIRKRIKQSFPGKIVDVRLIDPKKKNQPYMYIVKLLRKDGKLLELKINATNATIVSVKGNG